MLRTGCYLSIWGLVVLVSVHSLVGDFLCAHSHLVFRFHFFFENLIYLEHCARLMAYEVKGASEGHRCHPAQAHVT